MSTLLDSNLSDVHATSVGDGHVNVGEERNECAIAAGRREGILISALRFATASKGVTYITTETVDLLVIPLATFALATTSSTKYDGDGTTPSDVSGTSQQHRQNGKDDELRTGVETREIAVGGRRYAVWRNATFAPLRRNVRDSMANSKWTQLDQLISVIPPGGSLGLDDKSFVFPSSSECVGWTVDGLVRVESGVPVKKFKDPRVIARCMIESQMFQLHDLLQRLLESGSGLTHIHVLSDWIGIISQILAVSVSFHTLPTSPSQPNSVSSYPTSPISQISAEAPSELDSQPREKPPLTVEVITPTGKHKNKKDCSSIIKHGLPTPPDSAFGNSRVGSMTHLDEAEARADMDLDSNVEVGVEDEVESVIRTYDPSPSTLSATPSIASASPDIAPPSHDQVDQTDHEMDDRQDEEVFPHVEISFFAKVDEKKSWESRFYPALEVEYNRLKTMVEKETLYPPLPVTAQLPLRMPAISRVLVYEPRRGSVESLQPMRYW